MGNYNRVSRMNYISIAVSKVLNNRKKRTYRHMTILNHAFPGHIEGHLCGARGSMRYIYGQY